jgi:SAM-dependent methyltransferase
MHWLRHLTSELHLRKLLGSTVYHLKRGNNVDKNICSNYFKKNNIHKLHIGCSSHILDTWLNSDFRPASSGVLHLDATGLFPFCDNQFDFIFSEHMIEHIDFAQGQHMLRECFRVLKDGKKIRVSTPDLQFLINLKNDNESILHRDYIKWISDRFIPHAPYLDAAFVINEYVRGWGHTFIYDERSLSYSLQQAGFTEIVRCKLNCSQDSALCGLENDTRMPAGFLALETITLEARKISPLGKS